MMLMASFPRQARLPFSPTDFERSEQQVEKRTMDYARRKESSHRQSVGAESCSRTAENFKRGKQPTL